MKNLIKILLATVLAVITFSTSLAQDIKRERMLSDLNVMQSILDEMFETRWEARGNTVTINSGAFSFNRNDHTSGTYLPGYGVVLTIPGGPPAFVLRSDAKGRSTNYEFVNALDDEENTEVTEEAIINRLREFFRYYSPNIGQLDGDDKITVIYGINSRSLPALTMAFSSLNDEENQQQTTELPATIHATVSRADLTAVTQGDITDQEFYNQINITTVDDNERTNRDLKIMARILKTSLEVSEDNAFRIRGSVEPVYVDGLGAVFFMDASYGAGLFGFGVALAEVGQKLTEIFESDTTLKFFRDQMADSAGVSFFDNNRNNAAKATKSRENRQQAYNEFMQRLKETVIDYGSTLKSVQGQEYIYLSISLPSAGNEFPDRAALQVQKSVLQQLSEGTISRKEAIDKISVWAMGSYGD